MASKHLTQDERREQLRKIMHGFDTAMLVTRNAEGTLHSRPLAIAKRSDDEALYFATAVESPKVKELMGDANVNVTMQDKRQFVSITGTAKAVQDRALVDQLWEEAWKVWFPAGKADPSLCVLVVEPSEATYWDSAGAQGLKFLFEAAKAYVSGADAKRDDDNRDDRQSAWVKL